MTLPVSDVGRTGVSRGPDGQREEGGGGRVREAGATGGGGHPAGRHCPTDWGL